MDMSKYKTMFLTESREHLAKMSQHILALEKDPVDKEAIDSLFRSAHSVKGMAASMGYEEISELSHKMEDLMDRFRKGEMTVSRDATDVLLEGLDILERLINSVEDDSRPEVDLPAVIARIKEVSAEGAKETPAEEIPIVELVTAPSSEPEAVETVHADAARSLAVKIVISQDSSAPAARAFLLSRKVGEFGRIISMSPSEADLRGGKFEGELVITLETGTSGDAIQKALAGAGDVASLTVEPFKAQASDTGFRPQSILEEVRQEQKGPKPEMTAPKEHELPKVVKVNTAILDYFVNTVGELIINKYRLYNIAKGLGSREMMDGLNQLDLLVRGLQSQVMSVRLMPIGSITERLPRVARDLARKQDKEIDFEMEGQEIELDRSILEELGNPLIHIIRNSIDHGIELPDERRRVGKPVPARIQLKASREKDQVLISVSDDGRGMDPEVLKRVAVKKGIVSEEAAASMSDKEALMIVCLPGFSTAKEVSDISGRGVGMDAVKSVVEPIGGSVDIESVKGEGTRIALRLPLTIAIMHSLLIELAEEIYAVPISRILRSMEVDRKEIRLSQKQRFIEFDGTLIPLLSLRKMLDLPPAHIQGDFISVVMCEIRGRTVGIVIDRLLGQQEIFVKPLVRPLNRISGLSGTTVLGNGKTIFLLDIGNLVQ